MEDVWSISREITLFPTSGRPPINTQNDHIVCDTIEELFETFDKMYKRDKMVFDRLKTRPKHNRVFDESKHPGYYTFSLSDRLLTVKIENFMEVANALFGYAKGEKHER